MRDIGSSQAREAASTSRLPADQDGGLRACGEQAEILPGRSVVEGRDSVLVEVVLSAKLVDPRDRVGRHGEVEYARANFHVRVYVQRVIAEHDAVDSARVEDARERLGRFEPEHYDNGFDGKH